MVSTPAVWFGWSLEQRSLFTPLSAFECWRRNSSRVRSIISNDTRGTHVWHLLRKCTHTHDCSQTQTSACILSAAALVHWNTGAFALRSAVRYTLLCKSDWDTQRDPVLSLRLPYKEHESRLRESSSVLLMLNLQSVLSLFCHCCLEHLQHLMALWYLTPSDPK